MVSQYVALGSLAFIAVFLLSSYRNLNVIPIPAFRRLQSFENHTSLIPPELEHEICSTRALRFLSIGRANAQGSGLMNPDKESYPKLLCSGHRVSGEELQPSTPARCVQTIIKDNIYDVIVIDFYEETNAEVEILAQRLRKRFPNALIINMKAFLLAWAGYFIGGTWVSIQNWAENMGHINLDEAALEDLSASTEPWEIFPFALQDPTYDQINQDNFLWYLYKENHTYYNAIDHGDVKDMIIRRAQLFLNWNLFNPWGHQDVACGVMSLANNTNAFRSDSTVDWSANSNEDSNYNCPI